MRVLLKEGAAAAPSSPRAFMNAQARVLAVKGRRVEIELDAGDRDRIQRATGKEAARRPTVPLECVEKVK
jgi:hypothetical protein